MMTTVFSDSSVTDEQRRELLFRGEVFVYSASPATTALISFARELIAEAFGDLDPETAQHVMPVEEFAKLLADLKPRFIHHPRCKELLPAVVEERGCDLGETYFDVPRLRTSTSNDYLVSGISYAFHPRYFDTGVRNSSRIYNYAEWVAYGRTAAAQQVHTETRKQPAALEGLEPEPDLRVITPPGGVLLFSGAQLHSTVPNTSGRTRFSIDFRAVNLRDVQARAGARNVDSECTGTTLGDFLRATDLAPLPADLIESYDTVPA